MPVLPARICMTATQELHAGQERILNNYTWKTSFVSCGYPGKAEYLMSCLVLVVPLCTFSPGVAVGMGESATIMSKFEYVDDAARIEADAATAPARVTSLAADRDCKAACCRGSAEPGVRRQHFARVSGGENAVWRRWRRWGSSSHGHHTNYIRLALQNFLWTDHRLSCALKLRTYQLAVCSTLTHASEAWMLTEPVMRSVNGFNSRCLHAITGQDYRRVGGCDVPWWHLQSAATSTLRAASSWTARQWRWTS